MYYLLCTCNIHVLVIHDFTLTTFLSGAVPQEPKAAELKFWTKTDGQVKNKEKKCN